MHIVGAGLAGLAAAVALSAAQRDGRLSVRLHEAAGHAGGRCRSFHDRQLDRTIDNGNHLILAANRPVFDYLDTIGAAGRLVAVAAEGIPFVDLADGSQWRVNPGRSRLPWWLLRPADRVAGTQAGDYLAAALRLARAPAGATVGDVLNTGTALYRRLLQPLAVALLNTEPPAASARLFAASLRSIFALPGGWRPYLAAEGLSAALVEPALTCLARAGILFRPHHRLRALVRDTAGRVGRLVFTQGEVDRAAEDRLILALPPEGIGELLPGLGLPVGSRSILNGHFLLPWRVPAPALLGCVGGMAEWLFLRHDVAAVTVSAADALIDRDADDLAATLWAEVATALALWQGRRPPAALPAFRLLKERRATFLQSPANQPLRPATDAVGQQVLLAGDWTATGLPATVDGAIRSGRQAAQAVLSGLRANPA